MTTLPMLRHFLNLLIACFVLAFACPLTAAEPPSHDAPPQSQSAAPLPNFKAVYNLNKGRVLLGVISRELRTNGDGIYTFESISDTAGFLSFFAKDHIIERSLWRYHATSLQPLTYYYDRSGGKKSKHVHLNFDWPGKKIIDVTTRTPWPLELPEGTQDSQLYQLALMQQLQRGEKKFAYQVAEDGKLKSYPFEVLGEESVTTELGTFQTLKVLNDRGKRQTVLWCAKQLNYLPVQMEQLENGHLLRLHLTKIEGLPRR